LYAKTHISTEEAPPQQSARISSSVTKKERQESFKSKTPKGAKAP